MLVLHSSVGGVWMFFLLSGYFSGCDFFANKYQYTIKRVFKFYLLKFVKIAVPSYFFVFLLIITQYSTYWKNTDTMIRILTFRFNGTGGVAGIGALWYVSTLMQLTFITPFLCFIFTKIYEKCKSCAFWRWIVGIIIICGFLWRIFLFMHRMPWQEWVYTFAASNLDIYCCGLLCNILCIRKRRESAIWMKLIAVLGVFLVIGSNMYIYYLGDNGSNRCIWMYQYIYPSLYILVLVFYIVVFHSNQVIKYGKRRKIGNIIIYKLSNYTFWFYLWHSFVLNQIYTQIQGTSPVVVHIKLLVYAASLSLLLVEFFESAFEKILSPYLQKIKDY